MIIALVWLYFAFTATVLFDTLNQPNIQKSAKGTIEVAAMPILSEEAKLGKTIFKSNCASCHNKNMTSDLTGPALKGVSERWAKYPKEDLYAWIRNADKLTASKHPRAIALKKAWDNDVMMSFEQLSDEDIANLIAYIER